MLKEQELTLQRTAIVKDFYRSFDPSLSQQSLKQTHQLGLALGEGRHFKSYRLPARGPLALAINLAKASFLDRDPRQKAEWKKSMAKLERLQHPLLPPFQLVEDAENLGYVLPYCESAVPQSEWSRLGLSPWIEDCVASLASAGLWLDDYLQLRACRGHPLLIDYSDLKPLK